MFRGAKKNRLIETALLSTHNIGLGGEIRKFALHTYLEACLHDDEIIAMKFK